MKYLDTLEAYCEYLEIPPPGYSGFDIRSFEENMPTIKRQVEPFKHEFYAVGLLYEGTSHVWNGIPQLTANILFNSPYQLISWEIENDWSGYYLLCTQDFLSQYGLSDGLLLDFPFLKLDQVAPFSVPQEKVEVLASLFKDMLTEYRSTHADKFEFIAHYLKLLLLNIRRFQPQSSTWENTTEHNMGADVKLVTQFQEHINSVFNQDEGSSEHYSTSFYADLLAIHPNHLNAVVKRITGKTAKHMIQEQVFLHAKAYLLRSTDSVKEIAFAMGFNEPAHFSSFFKKFAQVTPTQFRRMNAIS
ncbi:MAG: helix-turn-helix domain-containing protein [Bacteroidota bacterium]